MSVTRDSVNDVIATHIERTIRFIEEHVEREHNVLAHPLLAPSQPLPALSLLGELSRALSLPHHAPTFVFGALSVLSPRLASPLVFGK